MPSTLPFRILRHLNRFPLRRINVYGDFESLRDPSVQKHPTLTLQDKLPKQAPYEFSEVLESRHLLKVRLNNPSHRISI